MKRKHWQGYGTVNIKVLKREDNHIVIKVSGNHECGLSFPFYDPYRLTQWMGKLGSFKEEEVESYVTREQLVFGIDECIYDIKLRRKE